MDEQAGSQAAFQKENCLFCRIVDGKIPSRSVFEDELVMAVLDINPASAGHVLLMPKEHYLFMPQVPAPVISRLFIAAKRLSQATLRAVRSEGTTILVANGGVAGQRAPHFMVHLIPRLSGDGLLLSVGEGDIAGEVQAQVNAQLKPALSAFPGSNEPSKHATPAAGKETSGTHSSSDLDAITDMLAGGNGNG
ncbi:HIT domain-containing protein [Candidatus Woesearchaeota archaeon]|nr:HIT domain-containing protein [Candidatus Woesearchaeota archaeon]